MWLIRENASSAISGQSVHHFGGDGKRGALVAPGGQTKKIEDPVGLTEAFLNIKIQELGSPAPMG